MRMSGVRNPIVEIRDLTKRYGSICAVDGVSLVVHEGEIFGLLGPNGAGKTTTILMLMGLTEPTAGSIRVCGCDPVREPLEVKRLVGYLPDRVSFYEDMTAVENLLYTASLNGIPRDEARERARVLLEKVGLASSGGRKVREFSRGMIQRLGMADVLMKRPRVVILDEPTLGIDPAGVREILDFIVALRDNEGITVLLSTHLLHQVQEMCERIAVFFGGKVVAEGPIRDLCSTGVEDGPFLVELIATGGDGVEDSIARIEGVRSVRRRGEMLLVECEGDMRERISETVFRAGGLPVHLRIRNYGLEGLYHKYFHSHYEGGSTVEGRD